MPTAALKYFENVHGTNTEFLSKSAIIEIMNRYADLRYLEYQRAKQEFQAEQWVNNETNARKGKTYNSPNFEKPSQ
jgi:hypothetical protein